MVTGGTINFYGITATSPSWLAEIIVDLHGLVEATGVQLDATEGPGTVASVSGELTPPFEGWNAGGTVELWAYELYDDPEVSPDGTIGNVVLQLEFTLPTPLVLASGIWGTRVRTRTSRTSTPRPVATS